PGSEPGPAIAPLLFFQRAPPQHLTHTHRRRKPAMASPITVLSEVTRDGGLRHAFANVGCCILSADDLRGGRLCAHLQAEQELSHDREGNDLGAGHYADWQTGECRERARRLESAVLLPGVFVPGLGRERYPGVLGPVDAGKGDWL